MVQSPKQTKHAQVVSATPGVDMSQIKVELLRISGKDEDIANAAWVSSGRQSNRTDNDVARLLKMISSAQHTSCYEHITFAFRIEAPLYILNQITRHRIGMSYNQASRRYQFPFKDFYRLPLNTATSIKFCDFEEYHELCEQSMAFYNEMRDKYKKDPDYKRIMELLSGVLPVGVISALVVTMNLRSWLHFYKLRSDIHAQPEIQEVAAQSRTALEQSGNIPVILGLELGEPGV